MSIFVEVNDLLEAIYLINQNEEKTEENLNVKIS